MKTTTRTERTDGRAIERQIEALAQIEQHAEDLRRYLSEFDQSGKIGLARASVLIRCKALPRIAADVRWLKDEIESELRGMGVLP